MHLAKTKRQAKDLQMLDSSFLRAQFEKQQKEGVAVESIQILKFAEISRCLPSKFILFSVLVMILSFSVTCDCSVESIVDQILTSIIRRKCLDTYFSNIVLKQSPYQKFTSNRLTLQYCFWKWGRLRMFSPQSCVLKIWHWLHWVLERIYQNLKWTAGWLKIFSR